MNIDFKINQKDIIVFDDADDNEKVILLLFTHSLTLYINQVMVSVMHFMKNVNFTGWNFQFGI